MTHILLTGAGFSRNWGGWLANEAFEYLLGAPEIDDHVRHQLWLDKQRGGGFEATLATFQQRGDTPHLRALHAALVGMFNEMNLALSGTTFEPQTHNDFLVRSFLVRFDAIFTLNQDLLLEHHYLDDNISLSQFRRWHGHQLPGTQPSNPNPPYHDPTLSRTAVRIPRPPEGFVEEGGLQPYYKLHGSIHFSGGPFGRLLIMGGGKALEIETVPLLKWYHQKFVEYLSRPDARLMIIGYSFSDEHINRAITEAASRNGLRLFIVDPQGVDVLDPQDSRAAIHASSALMNSLSTAIIGASRRPLSAIFGNDRVEHSKVMRFFGKT